jgi:lysophospholipase L1-like esterase
MNNRSATSIIRTILVVATMAAAGLMVAPGVGQAATRAAKAPSGYYVSLGDSYSVGYQPTGGGVATAGYTAYIAKKQKLQLENFGCGGATTASLLNALGCTESGYGPEAATDAVNYDNVGETQVQAAVAFIAAHQGQVKLVTVSIGGNDVTACAADPNPLPCVLAAQSAITSNVTATVGDLSSALTSAGDTAQIVGLTYPDVLLGSEVYPTVGGSTTLATESIVAFDSLINPALKAAYTSVPGGSFVNVTSAKYKMAKEGDDTPLTKTTTLAPYGTIPRAVWEICTLTYFCSQGNIHANTVGYTFIGKLAVADIKSH